MKFASANKSRRVPGGSPRRRASLAGTCAFVFIAIATSLAGATPASAQDYGGYRPSYQGYGVNTPGGRGGAILRVTHLKDTEDSASPFWNGSLRKALTWTRGPRIILFEVSGTINLVAPLDVTDPFVTIAGQSAPSPGILIRGAHLQISTHDVVIQHIRIRPGAVRDQPHGVWMRTNANNVVLDHVSISWTVWTAIDTFAPEWYPGVGDVAIIDSIVAEALGCSGVNASVPCNPAIPNSGMPNSRAFLFGDDNTDPTYNNGRQRITMLRNLSANNNDRQPAVQGDVDLFYINNLTYNPGLTPYSGIFWADGFNTGPSMTVAKGNLMIPGPTTPGNNGYVAPLYREEGDMWWGRVLPPVNRSTKIYLEGNYFARLCPNNACLASPAAQWSLVRDYVGPQGINVRANTPPLALDNLPLSSVMPYTAVENYVLANAGARPLDRDPVDARIVGSVRSRTGRTINTPNDVGGYPVLAENWQPLTVPPNPNQVIDWAGRTAIEAWLENMARALEPAAGGAAATEIP